MTDTQQPVRVRQNGGDHDVNGEASSQQADNTGASSTKDLRDRGLSNPMNLVPEEHSSKANLANGINGHSTTHNNDSAKTDRFDPNFTQNVINATGSKASPRIRKVMASLIRHIHDFARENEITVDEWMKGVEMVYCLMLFLCFLLQFLSNLSLLPSDQRSGTDVYRCP